jgi:hypothetical protein
MLSIFPIALSIANCAPAPSPIADACAWLHQFRPDTGFETRWTRNEKEQAVELNRNIANACRGMP